ncbi:hypothetical protein B0T18DRAFT_404250 [Schizothecium vesticola]|uniref:Uncharacterized protein n=1 Tax=Schizothecium vesticola TaxID=314040 RepID=A0AA40KAL9_9PEZI|nr:hypothetical protein B0T18DRAFT_404250 [Schizothecium vesticola]
MNQGSTQKYLRSLFVYFHVPKIRPPWVVSLPGSAPLASCHRPLSLLQRLIICGSGSSGDSHIVSMV